MSSKNDNLFLDSDEDDDGNDTDDLLATAAASSTTTKKKKLGSKSKSKAAADNDSEDDDNDNDDSDEDLFADSDDEGEGDDESDNGGPKGKKKGTKKKQLGKNKKKKKLGKASQKANMSKKEKMEALARKRQRESEKKSKKNNKSERSSADSDGKNKASKNKGDNKESGYDSGDSYNSATFQRTKEDDDFIDTTGEDEDALKEYHAEQHFDDERPMGSDSEEDDEDGGHKKKKQRKGASQKQSTSVDALSQDDIQNKSDNPIVQAVLRMKKKKQVKLDEDQIEFEVKEFLRKMDYAADQDDLSIKNKTPATQKILMLSEVMQMLTKVDWQQKLLDEDLLMICKRWIEPLPNGKLGNITVRQRILETIGRMRCGTETGITPQLLKRSNFGKVVMQLYMHPDETPQMKTLHKKLIDQWSRHIFNKTSNMRDLSNVRRGESSMMLGAATSSTAYSNNAHLNRSLIKTEEMMRGGQDLGNILAGNRGKGKYSNNNQGPQGSNRVRVPMSKGFHFTKRPEMRKIDPTQKLEGSRGNLNKTMMKRKQRTSGGKNHNQGRSVQMSADGKGLNR